MGSLEDGRVNLAGSWCSGSALVRLEVGDRLGQAQHPSHLADGSAGRGLEVWLPGGGLWEEPAELLDS